MSRCLGTLTAGLLISSAALAADSDAAPAFAFADGGWQAAGVVFMPPASGPGPVQDIPGRPRIGNNLALGQPTFAMADLNNPILQPWARDAVKKVNDHVAAGGGGFTPQVWDVAGNEANFFVRDVTSGSRLPFRIRPGAPTSSLDIWADGYTGINTAAPNLKLEVLGSPGLPVNSGTAPTGITRFSQSGGAGVIDFGFGGASGAGACSRRARPWRRGAGPGRASAHRRRARRTVSGDRPPRARG